MSDVIKISAAARTGTGSSESRRLRGDGQLPGVIYSEGKEAVNIQLDSHAFGLMLQRHASESLLIDLDVDGKVTKALLREVQHHPVNGRLIHVDFFEVSMTKKLRAPVSIDLVGDPVGVEQGGGVLDQLIYQVEVECLPADLVEKIEVDVSGLEVGSRLLVGDIELDTSKLTVLTAADVAVAAVAQSRVSAVAAAEDEEAANEEAAAEEAQEASAE